MPHLARGISEERGFEDLPGLADAAILGHLRGPGPHIRACWTLDLLLEKARLPR